MTSKIFSLLGFCALLSWAGWPAMGQAEAPDSGESNASVVAERLDSLEERARSSDSRLVRFVERRRFPFRSKPVELEGIARIDQQLGTSIEYPSKSSVIVIDGKGLLMRTLGDDGEVRGQRELPQAEGAAGRLMTRLFQFDRAALEEEFRIEASGDDRLWSLTLHPKNPEAAKIEQVRIESDREGIRLIDIQLGGRRGFEIEPVEEVELEGFSDAERERYFRR